MAASIYRFLKANWILLLVIAIALAVRLIKLSFPYGDYDEGVYIATVRSLLHGSPLYGKTYDSQGPLFFYLAAIFYWISPTIESVRLLPVICSLLAIFLAYKLTYRYFGLPAAIFTGLYLALDTYFLTISRTFQLDVPWVSLSAISFYFLLSYHQQKSRSLIIYSALFFALSLLLKLNPIFAIVIIGYFLLVWYLEGRKSLLSIWYFIAIPVVLFLIFVPSKDWSLFYASSVEVRTTHLSFLTLSQWLTLPRSSLLSHERFLLLIDLFAAGFFIVSIYHNRSKLKKWLSDNIMIVLSLWWLLVTTVVFDYYSPLFPHHFVFLIFPAVLVASWIIEKTHDTLKRRGPILNLAYIIIFGLIIFYSAWQGTKLTNVLGPHPSAYNLAETSAASFVKSHTQPNDYIITDDQLVAYLANRDIVPGLVDTSFVTIQTNGLTNQRAIDEIQQYQPTAIVLLSGRLNLLPGFVDYLQANYPQITQSNGATIYQKVTD